MAKRNTKGNLALIILSIILAVILEYGYNNLNKLEFEEPIKHIETKKYNIVSSNLTVQFIDVGQADCILISNKDHNMLIDAGNNDDGKKIVNYIKELGINKFDYVVGTHPHEDHIGGLDNIIDAFDIDNVYLPNAIANTSTFESVISSLEKKNYNVTIPTIGDKFNLGEAEFEILYTGEDEEDLNNSSIVLKMIFGNYSYMFMGDASSKVEQLLSKEVIDVDVLKVGHHGSKYSSKKDFLSKVTPDYAIISVGKDNSYGHPSKETIDNIKKYTDKIYRTDQLGTIILTSDGTKIEINSIETDTNGE